MLTAAAKPYEGHPTYYHYLNVMYSRKMDILIESTRQAGLIPLKTEGSFFLVCDISNIQLPAEYQNQCEGTGPDVTTKDWAFCR